MTSILLGIGFRQDVRPSLVSRSAFLISGDHFHSPSTSPLLGPDRQYGTARAAHNFIGRCPGHVRGNGDVRGRTQPHEDEVGLGFQGYLQDSLGR